MKRTLGTVASVFAQELPLAEICNEELCLLPDCRCSSTDIPGGLAPRNTPQFVTISFDDAVTAAAMPNYRDVVFNRRNSNGCPAGATFYVSHEWTDYSAVNELYNNGFELGLNSISHRTPQTYWMEATYNQIKEEIADQKQQIARFANVPESEVRGTRAPFLQLSGNNTFGVMKDYGLTYDCSWGTIDHTNPGLWPYTLDYASIQDCQIPPCPSASIPGVWVLPMVAWFDLSNFPCVMADACVFAPDREDSNAWFKFILQNFERHYMGNRAPFGFFIHEAFLRSYPQVKEATIKFIELVSNLNDAFMVNSNEVIEWVKDPVPLSVYRSRPCKSWVSTPCRTSVCELVGSHNSVDYYMTVCGDCPRTYPWVGNPLGN